MLDSEEGKWIPAHIGMAHGGHREGSGRKATSGEAMQKKRLLSPPSNKDQEPKNDSLLTVYVLYGSE